jgi:hypothetical protein
MDLHIEYQQAQELLAQLKLEEARLPSEFRTAADEGNPSELKRIKQRMSDIPDEIFAAEILLRKANINRLRAERSDATNRLDKARAYSKKVDEQTTSALRVLNEERTRINETAYTALVDVYDIQAEVQRLGGKITQAEKELAELLDKAMAA